MDSAKLRELLATLALRFSSGNSVPVERAHITRTEYDALLDELDALRALRARVEAAPIGTAWLDAHPWPTIDDIDVEKGRRFRLLAVDAGEVAGG